MNILTLGICILFTIGAIVTAQGFITTIQMDVSKDDIGKIMQLPISFGLITTCAILSVATYIIDKNGMTFKETPIQ